MEPRLKTEIRVKALIRRCDLAAIGVAVTARGDPDAGAILIKLSPRAGGCTVLAQARRPDGAAVWMRATGPAPVPEAEAEFNAWYNEEHLPALGSVPGVLMARRYCGQGATQRYLAMYHFARSDVREGDAWKRAANTPWTEKMRPHFRDYLRLECRPYERAR